MHSPPYDLRPLLRWIVLITIVLVACVVWLEAVDSGIAKLPILSVGAMLVTALFATQTINEQRFQISLSTLQVLILLHVPLFIVSAVVHFDPVYTLHALSLSISCLVFFFAAAGLFTTESQLGSLFTGLEWLAFLLCVVAALQYIFRDALPLSFGLGPDRRVMSLLDNSGYFASYLVIMFPLVLGRVLSGDRSPRGAAPRIALGIFMLLMLIATQTRSSLLACGVSTVVFIVLVPLPRKIKVAGIFLTVLLFGGLYLPYVNQHEPDSGAHKVAEGGRGSTLARRLTFWQAGYDAFRAAPLFGHGIGGFERSVMEFRAPDYWKVGSEDVVPHAHNEIVEAAVEYGCTGLFLMIASFTLVIAKGMGIGRYARGQLRWIAAGITCGLIGIAVDNLASVSLRQPPTALLAWVMMGLLCSPALSRERRGMSISIPVSTPRYAATIPLLLWFVASVWYLKAQAEVLDASVRMYRASLNAQATTGSALLELQTAVSEDPHNLLARSQQTLDLLNAERWAEALHAVDELQQLSPRYPKSHLMKAYGLFHLGRYREALESIQEELRQRSHPEAFQLQTMIIHALRNAEGKQEERSPKQDASER